MNKKQYKCQSYYDDNNVLKDCSCGKCGNKMSKETKQIILDYLTDISIEMEANGEIPLIKKVVDKLKREIKE